MYRDRIGVWDARKAEPVLCEANFRSGRPGEWEKKLRHFGCKKSCVIRTLEEGIGSSSKFPESGSYTS